MIIFIVLHLLLHVKNLDAGKSREEGQSSKNHCLALLCYYLHCYLMQIKAMNNFYAPNGQSREQSLPASIWWHVSLLSLSSAQGRGWPDLHKTAQPQEESWDGCQWAQCSSPCLHLPSPQLVGFEVEFILRNELSSDNSCETVSVCFLTLPRRSMTSPALFSCHQNIR